MPRKTGGRTDGRRETQCFNEAGAVMPRKPEHRRSNGRIAGSFNEAGAVMPRKLVRMSRISKLVRLQ